MPKSKRPTSWGNMDVTLYDLECTRDLLDAVQIAISTGEMPSEAEANAVFGVGMLLLNITKELRAEWAADYSENDDAPP